MSQISAEQADLQVYAEVQHSAIEGRKSSRTHASPGDVGRIANILARKHYFGGDHGGGSDKVKLATLAGLVVYALELYGENFSTLCDVSDFNVAAVVSGLSPDVRLPATRRVEFHCTTLHEADDMAQLVKLAEIIATARRVELYPDDEVAMHSTLLLDWAEGSAPLCDYMEKLKQNPETRVVVAETKSRLLAIRDRIVSVASRRRVAPGA